MLEIFFVKHCTCAIRSISTQNCVPLGIISPFGSLTSVSSFRGIRIPTTLASRTTSWYRIQNLKYSGYTESTFKSHSLIKAVVVGICFSVWGLITLDSPWTKIHKIYVTWYNLCVFNKRTQCTSNSSAILATHSGSSPMWNSKDPITTDVVS